MNQMRKIKKSQICFITYFFTLAIFAGGCSVLTESQVKEVNKFAHAAKSYGTFPGAVVKSHSDIRKTQKMLEAATFTDGEQALRMITENVVSSQEEFEMRAAKADMALDILNNYAELLVKLTSDIYTNELQASAENLGESIDKGIKTYNKEYRKNSVPLESFGSVAAALVRGGGGIYIKRLQSKGLKEAVGKADPVVNEIISDVEDLLVIYLDSPGEKGLIRSEEESLKEIYKNTVTLFGGKLPFKTVSTVVKELEAVDDTILLTEEALKAAKTYREAHAELSRNLQQKQSLKGSDRASSGIGR